MKQYVIDELRMPDHEKLKSWLDENGGYSGMDGLYWFELESEVLNEAQSRHAECAPFYYAVQLEEDRLICELLIRTRNRIKCDCIRYADANQRNRIIESIDRLFEQLEIIC